MSFINDDFLLGTKTARELYHGTAEGLPIIDYHCHVDPAAVAADVRYKNITEVWLGGDHYKWRLIRADGVPEDEITGGASDRVKFDRFCAVLPKCVGNPVNTWAHLELKRYFGYDGVISPETADEIWELTGAALEKTSVNGIIRQSNVFMIGTTDDPADSLGDHVKIAREGICSAAVLPSFRPDRAINIDKPGFDRYIGRLSAACGFTIDSPDDLKHALSKRLDFFVSLGCRASDHGLDRIVCSFADGGRIRDAFRRAAAGEAVPEEDADAFKTDLLLFLGEEYARRGIVMQLHYGAQRNVNSRAFGAQGPDTGYDCISARPCGEELPGFLDALERRCGLPKTVVYSLNPADNAFIDSVLGCFGSPGEPGRLQHGSAWWFNDTKSGITAHLRSLADSAVLGNFIGMLTDSRSFLSYTRHEYFRRILCSFIGGLVEAGEYPDDRRALSAAVRGICFENAKRFFDL